MAMHTTEQKALAAFKRELWWRFPEAPTADERKWSRVSDDLYGLELDDLTKPGADYFIGENPPEVEA